MFALVMDQGSCSVSIPTWQSGHCTYKVKIIFCKIKFGTGRYLSLTSFSEQTETRFGGWGSILLQPRSTMRHLCHCTHRCCWQFSSLDLSLGLMSRREQSHAHLCTGFAILWAHPLSPLSLSKSFLPHTALALAGGEKKGGGKVLLDWCFHELALTFWDLKTLFQTTFSHKALLRVPHRLPSSTLCCWGSHACGFLVRERSFVTVIFR